MTYLSLKDTIAAIATPEGKSGIGIVRISGDLCVSVAQSIFKPARASHPLPSHRACYGWVIDPSTGAVIDEVIAILMRAPRTYTREDCLEIQSHGGMAVLREILRLALDMGARLAQPGEFTLRAFVNGRIDLTQAEAVVDLIEAKSRKALEAASRQLHGELSSRLRSLKERIVEALACLEVAIDFPEEEVLEEEGLDMEDSLRKMRKELLSLIETYDKGKICREGASIMLIGPPNAGKSSLLNAMVGFERAIVTEIPGTTRDMVDAWIHWKGMPIRAIDTAGLRDPKDPIEEAGQRILLDRIEEADLIIWVVDGSETPKVEALERTEGLVRAKPSMLVINKVDLPQRLREEELPRSIRKCPKVRTSARHGTGVEEMLDTARQLLLGQEDAREAALFINERQWAILRRCLERVGAAELALKEAGYIEVVASELHRALGDINEVLGEGVDEEVLSQIFSRFCVGK